MVKNPIQHDDLFPGITPFYKLDVRDMNDKFLQLVCITLEEQSKKILNTIVAGIIVAARKYVKKTSVTAGIDGLNNLWEDYCYQKRTEESVHFKMQEEIISGLCYKEMMDLKSKNRDQYNILTLFLSVSAFNYEERMLEDTEIEDFLLSEVKRAAVYSPAKLQSEVNITSGRSAQLIMS